MKSSHWMKAAAAVLVLAAVAPAAWTAPAPGDKSSLAQVPASAPVVIHINGLEAVRDHVVAFLKNAGLSDQADLVQSKSDDFLKTGFQGRKLKGLAKDGPIFVVFTELPKPGDTLPKMAIIAAVTSYSDFRDNILSDKEKKNLKQGDGFESTVSDMGGDVFFVDKKDYVVVTPRKDVAASFTKTAAAGLDGKISKEQAAKLLSSDFGVYVSVDILNKEYADQIKAAHKAVDEQLKTAEETLGKAQKAQFEIAKKLIGPVFQAVEDSQGALVTVEVRPGGVNLHTEAEVRAGTPTADLLKGAKQSAFKDLNKLPAGQVFYSGMDMSPTLLKLAGSMLTGLSTDPDSKGAKALAEAFDDWTKSGPTESMGAISYPISGVQVVKCADADKALASQLKMLQAMGTEGGFQNVYFKEKPEVKEKAEKYKDVEFTSVHMVWDLEKTMSAAGGGKELPEKLKKQMAEAMKQLMGENMNMWLAADGKSLVTVMAKDWDGAQKLLDQYYKGDGAVGDDKAFAAARKELPNEASFLMMMDAVQYVGVMVDFIKPIIEASGAPMPAKFPTAVKGKPGFVGMAVTLDADRGGFDMFVSSDAVKQIYKGYVVPLIPTRGN